MGDEELEMRTGRLFGRPRLGVKLLREGAKLPTRAHDTDAGMDVYACLESPMAIAKGNTAKVPLGIALDIPPGYFIDVRGRSGNELRGQFVVRLGTVDAGYRNELCAIVHALGVSAATGMWPEVVNINPGDKIAQLVLRRVESLPIVEVSELSETSRGANGFGSSDKR